MTSYDVFNGDADGIISLVQLRNAEPKSSTLVTGVKRKIALLDEIEANAGDQLTVLDVSMDKNRAGLERVLEAGAEVFYVDHHFAGEIPDHDKLTHIINTDANVCTSLLVNGHLQGRYAEWAVAGAFGDNLKASARSLAEHIKLDESRLQALENLGTYINYNGYGSSLDDLHFSPEALFRLAAPYASPFAFMDGERESFEALETGYRQDMSSALSIKAHIEHEAAAVLILPNEKWARRVSGVYSNDLANGRKDRAHAVLTNKDNGNFLVSVRAPLNNKTGADELCRQFATGGGRQAAAGINDLPANELDRFVDAFVDFYSA